MLPSFQFWVFYSLHIFIEFTLGLSNIFCMSPLLKLLSVPHSQLSIILQIQWGNRIAIFFLVGNDLHLQLQSLVEKWSYWSVVIALGLFVVRVLFCSGKWNPYNLTPTGKILSLCAIMEFGGIKEVCLTGQFLNLSSLLTCAVRCMKKNSCNFFNGEFRRAFKSRTKQWFGVCVTPKLRI